MWNLIVTIVFAVGSSANQNPAAAIEAVPTPYMTEALCKKAADNWHKSVSPALSGGKAIATCSPAR